MTPTAPDPANEIPRRGFWQSRLAAVLVVFLDGLGLAILAALYLTVNTHYDYQPVTPSVAEAYALPSPYAGDAAQAAKVQKKADKALKKVVPRKAFIVIDRVHNTLELRKGDELLRHAEISCGAGSILEDPKSKRTWVFDTPIGRFRVVNKRENPLWTAPDWEYIEANEPLPRRYSERVQDGMLGEYALDLNARGYMIHGTLYSRLLGRNVSHGCVRVGRDDLRVVWKNAPVGTPVFIY
jgi:L,D-transpeptidase YbiS